MTGSQEVRGSNPLESDTGGDKDDTVEATDQEGTQAFGLQPVEGSDMFLNILGWDGTDPVTYPSAPLYSIHLDQSGTYTFPAQSTGYGAQIPLTVTVTNSGNQPTGTLSVSLSGTNASSFSQQNQQIFLMKVATYPHRF